MSPGRRSGPALLPRTASDEVGATVPPIVQPATAAHQNATTASTPAIDPWGQPRGQAGNYQVTQQPGFNDGYRCGMTAGLRIGWRHGMPAGREQLFQHLLQCFLATPLRTYVGADVFELLGERRQATALREVTDRARERCWKSEELQRQARLEAELDHAGADRYQRSLDARAALDAQTPPELRQLALSLWNAYSGATAPNVLDESVTSNGCNGSSAHRQWDDLPTDEAHRWRTVALQVTR